MKFRLFILISFFFVSLSSVAQTTYTESPMNYVCGNYDSGGSGIRTRVWPTPISGNNVTFRTRKIVSGVSCTTNNTYGNFGTSGTARVREGSISGPIQQSCSLASCGGAGFIDLSFNLSHISGTKNYYVTIDAAGFTYWAGPVAITANPACTDPNITSTPTTCQSSTYSVIATFTGTSGSVYDIFAEWGGTVYDSHANVSPGTYTLSGIPHGQQVAVIVEDDQYPTQCKDSQNVTLPSCGPACTNPNITSTPTTCQSNTYSVQVTFTGTSGSVYDVFASWGGQTHGSSHANVPPGTYTITGIPHGQQVAAVVEDDQHPTQCNDSQNVTLPSCTSGPCSTFNGLTPGTEEHDAAVCLCNAGYIQDNPNINAYNNIIREDLAKVAFLGINQGTMSSVASSFPVPFDDLQNSSTGYHLYAKALSYLEYDDGISPFDRKFTNFNPGNPIQRRYAMKVLLETFDIDISYTNGGTIEGLTYGMDAYEYVKTAKDLGYISGNYPNAQDNILRIDVFLILYRILSDSANNGCSGDCDLDCYALPNESLTNGDYFVPGQFVLNSLARIVGLSEGYFDSYKKTSFNIPGRNVNLEFTHLYNSFLLEIPSNLRQVCPLGEGWSHSYNSYVIEEDGSNGGGTNSKLYVFWPNGSITKYKRSNLANETIGNFDIMSESGNTITVTKKSQIKYIYAKHNGVWYLDKIEDRNGNFIDIVLENGAPVNGVTPRRINRVNDQHGRTLEFYYPTGKNTLNRVRDISGNRNIYFTVNNDGDLVTYKNPKGKNTTYQYGVNQYEHYLEKITLPEGNTIDVDYDLNRRVKEVQFPGVSQPFAVNAVPNYGSSQPYSVSMENPSSNIDSDMEFNANGRMTEHVSGNTTTTIGYTADQLPNNVNVAGQATTYTYDGNGNVLIVTQPLGIKHTYTYNSLNDLKTYKDPKGKTTTYVYDGNDNLDKVTDNMGFVTNYTISSNGLVTAISNPEGINTTFTYNSYGNTKTTNLPLGITTTFNYDVLSRNIKITNPLSQVTNMAYDLHDNVTSNTRVASGGNLTNTYSYDDNDNLLSINANGQVTSFTYNDRDLVETMTFGNDTKNYTYRNDNLLEKYTRPDGTNMNYSYDDQGRLLGDGYSTYTYDNRGNVKTIVKNGTTSFNYDAADRLKDYTDIYTKKTIYTYDLNSNVTKVTYPGGYFVDYEYDDNNRLIKTKFNSSSETINYTYYDDGRQKKVTYPNGSFTDYGYDAAGRMTSHVTKKSNGTIICSYTYTLDALGNHTNVTSNEPYSYPPPLAALTYNGTYNNENEQTTYGGSEMSYDANGEQQSLDGRNINWDIGGMITSSGNRNYVYDGIKLMREADRAGVTKRYAWDVRGMGNVIVEYNGSGTALYYYIHGNGLCARVKASNTSEIHYYHGDYRGSTVAMTDSNEEITHKYQYLPFGEIVQCEEADNDNPFKYVGKWGVMHEGGAKYYIRERQYESFSKRFLSEDPMWHPNLYSYSDNNPISFFDVSGRNAAPPEMRAHTPEFSGDKLATIGKVKNIIDFFKGPLKHYLEDYGSGFIRKWLVRYIDKKFDVDESFLAYLSTSIDIAFNPGVSDEYYEYYNEVRRNAQDGLVDFGKQLGKKMATWSDCNALDRLIYPQYCK